MTFSDVKTNFLILVADDNPSNRMMIQKILENYNFRVICVENGREAIAQLKDITDIDLLLMDINMPLMNGLETASFIRSSDNISFRHIPIIAITGNCEKEDIEVIKKTGINNYIAKPASPKKIIETIAATFADAGIAHDLPCNINVVMKCESIENFPCQQDLDLKKALSYLGDDISILKKLLRTFYSNYEHFISDIKILLNNKNIAKGAAMFHNLKGTSAQICAEELSHEAFLMEKELKKESICQETIERFEAVFEKTMKTVYLLSFGDTKEALGNELLKKQDVLHEFIHDLKIKNVSDMDKNLKILNDFEWNDDAKLKVNSISFFVKLSDFNQAIKTAKELLKYL